LYTRSNHVDELLDKGETLVDTEAIRLDFLDVAGDFVEGLLHTGDFLVHVLDVVFLGSLEGSAIDVTDKLRRDFVEGDASVHLLCLFGFDRSIISNRRFIVH